MSRRRPPSVFSIDPERLEALLTALPDRRAAALRADPECANALRGAPLLRSDVIRLKRRLVSAQLSERVDHTSAAFAAAKRAAAKALAPATRDRLRDDQ